MAIRKLFTQNLKLMAGISMQGPRTALQVTCKTERFQIEDDSHNRIAWNIHTYVLCIFVFNVVLSSIMSYQ